MTFFAVRELAINFGGVQALDGVSFEVEPGEVFTIIGPNGAGKTTIFNLISRIYDPTRGDLHFRDEDITRVPPHDIARRGIARTFQNIELFEHATVLQNLLLGRHTHRRSRFFEEILALPRVRALLARGGGGGGGAGECHHFPICSPYRATSSLNLPRESARWSRLAGASAGASPVLMSRPRAERGRIEDMAFWIEDITKLLGITVLMVEHDMSLVTAVSDRVLALNYGRPIAQGTAREVQQHPEVIKAYLGG